jgi:endo-1,4-beta-xylanase
LPIIVTEFNMPGQRSKYYRENIRTMTPEEEALKAKDLVDYYSICFAHPAVDGILMWGFWAGANWIPVSSLYNRDWSPSPAANAYQDLIYKTWWTDTSGNISHNGNFDTAGFYGTYKITVGGETREVLLSKDRGRVVVDFR